METTKTRERTVLEKFKRMQELLTPRGTIDETPGKPHILRERAANEIAAELEEWARTAPAGEVLDRVCAEWMGDEPERTAIVTEDGGESASAWVGDTWSTERELRGWLDNMQAKGYLADAVIKYWVRYRKYSEDPAAAMELLEAMRDSQGDAGLEAFNATQSDDRWYCRVYCIPVVASATALTPSLAIARACVVLAARGIKRQGGDG